MAAFGCPPRTTATSGRELSLDPGDPSAVIHHVFAQHSILRDGPRLHASRQVVEQYEPRKQQAPGKPYCFLFLLLVAGEECNVAEPF